MLLGQLQPGCRSIESPHSPNGHILDGLIKRNTAAILLGQCQKFHCGFICIVIFLGIFLNRCQFRLTGLIVEPFNSTHSFLLIHIFKGTGPLLNPASQKGVPDKVIGAQVRKTAPCAGSYSHRQSSMANTQPIL